MHQLRNSFGSLSPLSVYLFLSVCLFQSLIPCVFYFLIPLSFCFCHCFYMYSLQPVFVNVDVLHFHAIQSHISLVILLPVLFPSVSHYSYFLPHTHSSSTCDFFPLYMSRYLPWLDISFTNPHIPPIVHWMDSLLRPSLPAPTTLSPPLSLYLARRTSFPPWVLQTPVWKLKVEGEVVDAEEDKEEDKEER